MIRRRLASACITLFLGLVTVSAIARPLPVLSFLQDEQGVTFKLQGGVLRLDVCNDRTIRVRCGPGEMLSNKTEFTVTRTWAKSTFDFRDEPNKFVLRTARMGVEIDRATAAVAFMDAAGKRLLEEPDDGGKTVTADEGRDYRVQQVFQSPADERLYGMAQAQDGIWNWRGMPIELRQLNTQTAFPVMVSSRGFGLLWNDASLADFNPVDEEISLTADTGPAATGPTATEQLQGGRGNAARRVERAGTFTTTVAGEYVFFAKDGDRRSEIGIHVNGQSVAHIRNLWVPYTVAGKITLPANTTVPVRLLGGGRTAKVFARPLGDTTTFRSHAAENIDYYFFCGPEFDDVVGAYRNATGQAPMWPKWAFGFWQCRERYSSQKQIVDTAAEFRRRQIPIDLIVQDWQYWGPHGWGAYEWDAKQYPRPEAMVRSLHEQNVKYMISVWSNPQGKAGADLKAKGFKIGNTDWVDPFNPAARALRWDYLNNVFFKIGTDAWWQDATEPGDDGNAMAGQRVAAGSGDVYRNAYPLLANQTIYEGQRQASPDKRVVILTRSAFPGQQRYASALWSGDINGDWKTLRRQIPAGLHVSIAGLPYWTTDAGGFFRPRGQYESDDFAELLVRWFQYSTFCPIQRIHGYQSETEFWKYPKAEQTLVAYDKFRYRLLPYIYSVAWGVTNQHATMMRPLMMDFRLDAKTFDIGDQYMFGPALMVSPVFEAKATTRNLYLPAGTTWTNFWTGESVAGGTTITADAPREVIPLFVRAGSIVPIGPELQYADQKPADPIELRVYQGAEGAFTLYEDEGDSYRYENGVYATIPMRWSQANKTLTIGDRQGEFPGMLKERTFRVVWVRPGKGIGAQTETTADVEATYVGKSISVRAP